MYPVAIVNPTQYQRRRDKRDYVSMPSRSLHFGPEGRGLVRRGHVLIGQSRR